VHGSTMLSFSAPPSQSPPGAKLVPDYWAKNPPPPPRLPFVCHTPYNIGHNNVAASRRRAPERLRQPESRMRLAVRGMCEDALRTHSA